MSAKSQLCKIMFFFLIWCQRCTISFSMCTKVLFLSNIFQKSVFICVREHFPFVRITNPLHKYGISRWSPHQEKIKHDCRCARGCRQQKAVLEYCIESFYYGQPRQTTAINVLHSVWGKYWSLQIMNGFLSDISSCPFTVVSCSVKGHPALKTPV